MKKRNTSHITTLISNTTEVKGDIHFSGTLEIEGKVSGNITADRESSAEARVRENGVVTGDIKVPTIIINGLVEGDVYAGAQLELAAKAKVIGNVYYSSMEMVMGAEVNGNLHRNDGQDIKRLGMDKPEEADNKEDLGGNDEVDSKQAVNT